ncbi:MAG: YihY/virulence factor BrkB family protein [Candidatus Marinimicrobia bacterium]|nr:YihY/virulence factor BrkB family protein [Candidatus Neomarinimicrobiota bacterium]
MKTHTLPGFQGASIYEVFQFFYRGFRKGTLVTRASAVAFNLALAMIPSTIFLFTLIPFVPIRNFQGELLFLIADMIPENAYELLESTLVDVVTKKSAGLLLVMFFATIIFASNGIHALISSFNVSLHTFETRTWLTQRFISIVLFGIIVIMCFISIGITVFAKIGINKLVTLGIIRINLTYYLLMMGRWIVVLGFIFFIISFLYYLAPAKKTEWRFISPGSIVATLLTTLSSLGFSFYVNHFGQYNKLYGSIGTIMVILLLIYLISIALILGFELNASINSAKRGKLLLSDESEDLL